MKPVQDAKNASATEEAARVFLRSREGSLDNRTNIATPSPFERVLVDHATGEIFEAYDPTLKWQLQAVARLALGVFDPDTPYESGHRIRICYRHIIGDGTAYQRSVKIHHREDGKPYYSGLMTCGRVWVCPVCAAKIQQVRAAELRRAIDSWLESAGSVVMATYTIPHTRQDVLEYLLKHFNQAHRNLTAGKTWKLLTDRHQIAGQVKGLEVTWGANGWHVHAHVLYFISSPIVTMSVLADQLFDRWVSACGRVGITGLSRDAFTLQDASKAHAYVAKLGSEYTWGAEHELVKSHSKTGRGSSYTPFDFLRSYLVQPDEGQRLALFREFAACFHGRKQLVWSRGFKKQLLGASEASDEEIAASLGQDDAVLAHLSLEQWRYIRRYNMQGTVLQVAQLHGLDGIKHLLKGFEFDQSL